MRGVSADALFQIRWIACAPHMPGFGDIATPRITDPDDGLFFPDEHQGYGLGLRVYRRRGVKVVCHNGSIPVSLPLHTLPTLIPCTTYRYLSQLTDRVSLLKSHGFLSWMSVLRYYPIAI